MKTYNVVNIGDDKVTLKNILGDILTFNKFFQYVNTVIYNFLANLDDDCLFQLMLKIFCKNIAAHKYMCMYVYVY